MPGTPAPPAPPAPAGTRPTQTLPTAHVPPGQQFVPREPQVLHCPPAVVRSQPSPLEQVLFAQQIWVEAPQGLHIPVSQMRPLPQALLAQHDCPDPPQRVQIPIVAVPTGGAQ